jgi:peroxiredoxin
MPPYVFPAITTAEEAAAMATQAPHTELGLKAPSFTLPATDGKTYSLADVKGARGTVLMFICNHCPYVEASIDRAIADAKALSSLGIATVAICSNDAVSYPDDSFNNMRAFAKRHGFSFPYLHDETQKVARAYGAVCTPDYFGFNDKLELVYRGRLDEGRTEPPKKGAKRELLVAMEAVAKGGKAPSEQVPSVGCSIKWK